MRQQLESMMDSYQPMVSEQRQQTTYFVVGDLESLSASALYTPKINLTRNTAYIPLTSDGKIGVTHHEKGLGKLKYNEGGVEYGVPLIDIANKPLKDWRIDKK